MNYTTHRQFTESKLSPARDRGWTCTTSESFSLSVIVPVYNERHLVEVSLRRVLALNHDLITSLQLVAVDDCSTDGSWEVLQRLAAEDDRVLLLRHERNSGKGAAIRTALQHATGEICIVHDADLEYHPGDIPALLVPFAKGQILRPLVGDRVLEIGAGIGNLSNQFIPRELYVVSDTNPHYLHYLRSYAHGKPYVHVLRIDATDSLDFAGLKEQFDTALMINVLEHASDEQLALKNVRSALAVGGRAVILVPSHPGLYGSLDIVVGRRKRYTAAALKNSLEKAGFRVVKLFDFNRCSVPVWWLNGKLLKKKTFSKIQLKLLNTAVPVIKTVDRLLPWQGLSLIAVAEKCGD